MNVRLASTNSIFLAIKCIPKAESKFDIVIRICQSMIAMVVLI